MSATSLRLRTWATRTLTVMAHTVQASGRVTTMSLPTQLGSGEHLPVTPRHQTPHFKAPIMQVACYGFAARTARTAIEINQATE
ncbi:hypothetical protein PF005_g1794 [Phytophthora fragariae]|uniref:Uncharacterized protein n=2 Tax=Phytophthora TaxID=4783 RepID=A0A6A3UNK1_9STRA|nr:hypothetical protein PF003_g15505 [Phytophthora fragariae]KAE9038318.1 hypothetical protein PR002_g6085 [Phytophthora rubi]KAE8948612.1 hypothetical protein PF009_g1839 [Phytophthora fragariae]KAE9043530.1 hypothetical protein PR001_g5750 [Phytophthora rubi]KAE9137050.1 hypothetical protein PF010_g1473 [Phytophthora fragariae]